MNYSIWYCVIKQAMCVLYQTIIRFVEHLHLSPLTTVKARMQNEKWKRKLQYAVFMWLPARLLLCLSAFFWTIMNWTSMTWGGPWNTSPAGTGAQFSEPHCTVMNWTSMKLAGDLATWGRVPVPWALQFVPLVKRQWGFGVQFSDPREITNWEHAFFSGDLSEYQPRYSLRPKKT